MNRFSMHPLREEIQSIEALPAQLGFRTGHSTVSDGNMSYTFGPRPEVLASRRAFFASENLPTSRLATFFTDHRDKITDLDQLEFPFGSGPIEGELALTTDVIVTQQAGTGVFLGFADCVPFVVFDSAQGVLAFAHIGWRSMAVSLAHKLLMHLQRKYQSNPEDLIAVIGPSIKPKSYHFAEAAQWQNPFWHPHLERLDNGKTAIDLFGFCVADCERAGLGREQIYAYWADTATDETLFSHYQATEGGQPGKQGRHFFYGFME